MAPHRSGAGVLPRTPLPGAATPAMALRPHRRHRPLASVVAAVLLAAVLASMRHSALWLGGGFAAKGSSSRSRGTAIEPEWEASAEAALSRRGVLGALLPAVAAPAAWHSGVDGPAPAVAVELSTIVKEARASAARAKKKRSPFNPEIYKNVSSAFYDARILQEFLPNVILGRRMYEATLVQMGNSKVDLVNPETYGLMRQTYRLEKSAFGTIRRDLYRLEKWLLANVKEPEGIKTAFDRARLAINEEDMQLTVLARTVGNISQGGSRVAIKNLEETLDSIDVLLEFVPPDEIQAATAVADTMKMSFARLPTKGMEMTRAKADVVVVLSTEAVKEDFDLALEDTPDSGETG